MVEMKFFIRFPFFLVVSGDTSKTHRKKILPNQTRVQAGCTAYLFPLLSTGLFSLVRKDLGFNSLASIFALHGFSAHGMGVRSTHAFGALKRKNRDTRFPKGLGTVQVNQQAIKKAPVGAAVTRPAGDSPPCGARSPKR